MLHMKSVSLRQMQHNLSAILREVDRGREVLVTRRKRVVARLVPPSAIPAGKIRWPDFRGRTAAIKLKGPPLTQTLREEREA
jgi:antitoxin (DNA-binding transcriptional repressor) of toxin-antitoxin stability system